MHNAIIYISAQLQLLFIESGVSGVMTARTVPVGNITGTAWKLCE